MAETPGLTLEQRAANDETRAHIARVGHYITTVVTQLLRRGCDHDRSKLASPEVEAFAEQTHMLAGTTYGSPEYTELRRRLGPALAHHYANNRHHPEHHRNGVDDMDLLDVMEMLCDWTASSERHVDGDVMKSIEINAERFGICPQLRRIMENTVDALRREG